IIKTGKYSMQGQPKLFTLGKGHVKFFYDKLEFLRKRYELLYAECKKRGYQVTYFGDSFTNLPKELMNDYKPKKRDRELVLLRIAERTSQIEK
ncbi:MAG TPA: pyrimidine dimer DNA glycosylase/endonuclease V, partial [Fibrobacteraceae bacterium]|nr:pyrimidine dimer DNA glycosylase/endonuclease V [Fibrobacteraceae bacterium]